jgi:hypothetical protein
MHNVYRYWPCCVAAASSCAAAVSTAASSPDSPALVCYNLSSAARPWQHRTADTNHNSAVRAVAANDLGNDAAGSVHSRCPWLDQSQALSAVKQEPDASAAEL